MVDFMSNHGEELLIKTGEHIYISLFAIILGIIVAVPLGILLTRIPKVAGIVIGAVGLLQTFPSLAVLAFFIPIFGIGKVPAIAALFIYSVLPILKNTYISINEVSEDLKEAGRGMGMNAWESIKNVEIPLAMPVIMAGIRLSTVYLVSWATLAAFIGAGGLGEFIFNGLELYQTDLIIGGAIPVTLLAIITDLLLGRLEKRLTPIGIRGTHIETRVQQKGLA